MTVSQIPNNRKNPPGMACPPKLAMVRPGTSGALGWSLVSPERYKATSKRRWGHGKSREPADLSNKWKFKSNQGLDVLVDKVKTVTFTQGLAGMLTDKYFNSEPL